MKTCCVTAHRNKYYNFKYNEEHPECIQIKERLERAILTLYKAGYRHFIQGMASGGDQWFAMIIIRLKEKYNDITLESAIPCLGHREKAYDKKKYDYIINNSDKVTLVTEKTYAPYLMQKRNEYMIDKSDAVIAIYNGIESGGTYNAYIYAKKRGKKVLRIDPNIIMKKINLNFYKNNDLLGNFIIMEDMNKLKEIDSLKEIIMMNNIDYIDANKVIVEDVLDGIFPPFSKKTLYI